MAVVPLADGANRARSEASPTASARSLASSRSARGQLSPSQWRTVAATLAGGMQRKASRLSAAIKLLIRWASMAGCRDCRCSRMFSSPRCILGATGNISGPSALA